jgi:hypothetical protein
VSDFVCKFLDQGDTVNQIPTHPNGLHSDSIATAERSNSETWALEFGAAERGTVFFCSALPRRRYNLDASKFSMNRTWYTRNQSFSAGMTRLKRSDIKRASVNTGAIVAGSQCLIES